MIKNIIFDFGDVFMDLDKKATPLALKKLGLIWDEKWEKVNFKLETGLLAPQDFLQQLQNALPKASPQEILAAWNAVMVDFPNHRLQFLTQLSQKYRLFLLSNTDYIHFNYFENKWGSEFSKQFYACFEGTYYSYVLQVKKPNTVGFRHILKQHQLQPSETLFVDDNAKNTATAASLGLHTWTITVGKDDVVDLFSQGLPF